MVNRKGRPAIADERALRRVAEHLVAQEERGKACSARAAILHTSNGEVTGNSPDADLWRMQRKWRRRGQALLAEERERRARAQRREVAGAYGGSREALTRLAHLANVAFQESEAARALRAQDEVARVFRAQDEVKRVFRAQDEVMRVFPIRAEVARIVGGW